MVSEAFSPINKYFYAFEIIKDTGYKEEGKSIIKRLLNYLLVGGSNGKNTNEGVNIDSLFKNPFIASIIYLYGDNIKDRSLAFESLREIKKGLMEENLVEDEKVRPMVLMYETLSPQREFNEDLKSLIDEEFLSKFKAIIRKKLGDEKSKIVMSDIITSKNSAFKDDFIKEGREYARYIEDRVHNEGYWDLDFDMKMGMEEINSMRGIKIVNNMLYLEYLKEVDLTIIDII